MDIQRLIQAAALVVIAAGTMFLGSQQAVMASAQAQEKVEEEDPAICCDWYVWSGYQDCDPCSTE